jgi:heme/copper-type cytochrome/quinol oxidase subunit 2
VTILRRVLNRPQSAAPVVALLAVLALAGCGDDDPSPPPPSPPPAQPAALTLQVTGDDQPPSRVYEAPGQQPGTQPRFFVRPGQRLRIRVDNQDAYVHSLTLPQAGLDLNAWPREISTSRQVRAPTTPGVYTFFCRYAHGTMNVQLVISGKPVDTPEGQPPHDPLLLLPSPRRPHAP